MGIIFTGQPVKWCLPCIALFGKIAPKRMRCGLSEKVNSARKLKFHTED